MSLDTFNEVYWLCEEFQKIIDIILSVLNRNEASLM